MLIKIKIAIVGMSCKSVGRVRPVVASRWACLIPIAALLAAVLSPASVFAAATFGLHYVEPAADTTWATSAMQGTLSDLDNDGDLDWTIGNDITNIGFWWYEYQGPDTWVKHTISSGVSGVGEGAASFDVNADGYRDLVTGEYLYLNNGDKTFSSGYNIGTAITNYNHDHLAIDINKDGKLDLLSTNSCNWNGSRVGEIVWYDAPATPTQTWTKHAISTGTGVMPGYTGLHAATSPYGAGDLNGDGRIDVVGAQGWYENTNSSATSWTPHLNSNVFLGVNGTYQTCVRSQVLDLNGDGYLDIVQSEGDTTGNVRIAWLKNDGSGTFTRNIIRSGHAEDYHSLAVGDFDNDGDMDILTGAGPLAPAGSTSHSIFLFENTAGAGLDPAYSTHDLTSASDQTLSASDRAKLVAAFTVDHCHEPMFGDVNGDGKLDLILKGWDGTTSGSSTHSPAPFIYLENTTPAPAVTWTGVSSSIWSTAIGSGNWKKTSGDNAVVNFATGAAVIFDDSATGSLTANISAADVSPGSVVFTNSTKNFVVSGSKGIAGATGILKQGSGKLTISSVNSYSGVTTVSAGVVNIQSASALGTTAAATLVSSGAALQIQGGITTLAEPLTLSGTGVSNDGALRSISGSNTYAGLIALGSNGVRINSDSGTLTLSNTGTIGGSGYAMTVGGAGNTTINSAIGAGASTLTKDGPGTLKLTGANAYTGVTTVEAGELQCNGAAARNPVINLGGANIKAGTMIFDYTGEGTPAAAIGALLTTSYHSGSSTHFDTGKFQSSSADANHGLGWIENLSQQVLVAYTLYGDATVDGGVDISDLSALGQNWNGTGKNWAQGDFNYDGKVDISDLSALGQHWNQSVAGFSGGDSGAAVPEPATGILLLGAAATFFFAWWRMGRAA